MQNTNNTSGNNDILQVTSGEFSGGDPVVEINTGPTGWYVGIDNSNSVGQTIGQDNTTTVPGDNDALRITAATPPVISLILLREPTSTTCSAPVTAKRPTSSNAVALLRGTTMYWTFEP